MKNESLDSREWHRVPHISPRVPHEKKGRCRMPKSDCPPENMKLITAILVWLFSRAELRKFLWWPVLNCLLLGCKTMQV